MTEDRKLQQLQSLIGKRDNVIQFPTPVLKSVRNLEAIARGVFASLDAFQPDPVPERVPFSDSRVLAAWHKGGTVPEHLKLEFSDWLDATRRRSNVIEENKRKLRGTMWPEVTMRPIAPDFAAQFAEFHRHYWRIDCVHEDVSEREKQIEQAVRGIR